MHGDGEAARRICIREAFASAEELAREGECVRIDGWVRTSRDSGAVGFLEINDGSCLANLQAVLGRDAIANYQEAAKLGAGSSVSVTGRLAKRQGGGRDGGRLPAAHAAQAGQAEQGPQAAQASRQADQAEQASQQAVQSAQAAQTAQCPQAALASQIAQCPQASQGPQQAGAVPAAHASQATLARAYELQAAGVTVICASPPDYPLQKKRHTLEFLRGMTHLRPRTNTFSAAFRVRSAMSYEIHRFFQEQGFVYVHTPILTTSDSEGAGEMFRVTTLPPGEARAAAPGGKPDFSGDFFGREASLTVSGQLEAEAFALAFGKVYAFGPTFRAENSNTPRHAAEFWMVEPEIAFAGIAEDMDLAEGLVRALATCALTKTLPETEFFQERYDHSLIGRLEAMAESRFERMTYSEAVRILAASGERFEHEPIWGMDLATEHERYLTEKAVNGPVFVVDYPKEAKAFYMRQNDDGKTVAAMDLLLPAVGELIGGSQREERADVLAARISELGMDEPSYRWYVDLRRFGGVPHAGFGLGFERALMCLTGISNIRDVLPFPRTPGQAS